MNWKKEGATEEQITWIKWAKDKADWYDPLVNKNDEYLTDNDKLIHLKMGT